MTSPSLKSKFLSRNHIGLIDRALAEWEKRLLKQSDWDAKKKLLSEIVLMCTQWLEERKEKSEGGTYSQRAPHVKQLGDDAFVWLKFATFEAAKYDKQSSEMVNGQGNSRAGTPKALEPGYAYERSIHELSKQLPIPSMAAVHQGMSSVTLQNSTNPNVQAILQNKTFDQLTMGDVRVLDMAMGQVNMSQNVWFMSKTERMMHMLVVMKGEFYKGPDAPFHPKRMYVYAMNEYGSMFCIPSNAETPVQAPSGGGVDFEARLNHSTLNAGNPIVCAGEIELVGGNIFSINNNSGHYKPTLDDMHNAIVMLRDDGLNLANWQVGVRQAAGPIHYYNAQQFCQNKIAPGPVIRVK